MGGWKKKSSCRLLSLTTWSPGTSVRRRGAVTLISRITDICIQKYEFLLVCESSLDHQMLRHSLTLTAHQFHERFRNCLSISVRPGLSTCNCLFLFDLSILVWPVSQHSKFSYNKPISLLNLLGPLTLRLTLRRDTPIFRLSVNLFWDDLCRSWYWLCNLVLFRIII